MFAGAPASSTLQNNISKNSSLQSSSSSLNYVNNLSDSSNSTKYTKNFGSKLSPRSGSGLGSNALHGSMEDLFHPKNFRCGTPKIINSPSSKGTPKKKLKIRGAAESQSALVSKNFIPALNLVSDNRTLYEHIRNERKEALLRKATSSFIFGALKKQSVRVEELKMSNVKKTEECAAHMIMHALLLNSWRNDKGELEKLKKDNSELLISVENLGLQLRVCRHLQAEERDRAEEKMKEIRNLMNQVTNTQKSLKNSENEVKNVKEELRYAREDNTKVRDQRDFLKKELSELIEEKETLSRALEAEKNKAIRAEDEYKHIKLECQELRKQIKDMTGLNFQWQKRCQEFEAKERDMSLCLESRESALRSIRINCDRLRTELEELQMKKSEMHKDYVVATDKLKLELDTNEVLRGALEGAAEEINDRDTKLLSLEEAILTLREANSDIRSELYGYKLKNVRSRRAWVNTINQLNTPTKLFKFLIGGIVGGKN